MDSEGASAGPPAAGRPEREQSRRKRIRLRLLFLALAAWALLAVVSLGRAGVEARAGLRAAELARDAASLDATSPDALVQMRRARDRFAGASRAAGAVPVAPLRLLPVVGRQIRSLDALAGGAERVAGVSADALRQGQAALQASPGGRAGAPALLRHLSRIAAEAERRLVGVDLGPDRALFGPLADARNTLASRLHELRGGLGRGAAGAMGTADLLQGPRRYLVLAANNAEMRAGSGMFLSAGLLETGDGRLRLSPFQRTEDLALPPGAVPLEGDLAARWGWLKPNEEWRNLGVSPRFDATAPLAAAMWQAAGGDPVDGVLAVDAVGLRSILAAVGPVDVKGRTVGADDVVNLILHDQYVEFAADPLQEARREDLGVIAGAVMHAFENREWPVDLLGRELAGAARGRHILAWSVRPAEQAGWVAAGIDGSLGEDSVMVGVLNRGGNKLDPFLRVAADLALHPAGDATEGVLRLTLRNEVPDGEPPYVAESTPESGVSEGTYVGLLSVSLPGDARSSRIDGEDGLAVAGGDGPTRVVAAPIQLSRAEERTVVVRFELPRRKGALWIEPAARVPAIEWTSRGQRWEDGAGHALRW